MTTRKNENKLAKIEFSLKKEQIASKSWRNNFVNIATIKETLFNILSQQKDVQIFVVSIKNIDIELNKKKVNHWLKNNRINKLL